MRKEDAARRIARLRQCYENEIRRYTLFPPVTWEEALGNLRFLEELEALLEERERLSERQFTCELRLLVQGVSEYGRKTVGELTETITRGREALRGKSAEYIPIDAAKHGVIEPCMNRPVEDIPRSWNPALTGDLLYGKIRDSILAGRNGLLGQEHPGAALVSPEFFVLRPCRKASPEWILLCLNLRTVRETLSGYCVGAVIERLPRETFLKTQLPVPPLTVQRETAAAAKTMAQSMRRSRQRISAQLSRIDDLLRSRTELLLSSEFQQSPPVTALRRAGMFDG